MIEERRCINFGSDLLGQGDAVLDSFPGEFRPVCGYQDMGIVLPPHMITTGRQMIEIRGAGWEGHAEKMLAAVATQTAGAACEPIQVEHEHPYRAIIDTADSKGCDLIVMASHGRSGIGAIILGSETVKVLTHCKIPVLVYR